MTTTALPKNLGLAGAANLVQPRYLVSFAFDAPDKDAAQTITDQLAVLMQTDDALPAFRNLAVHAPIEVAVTPPAPWARSTVLILDSGKVSDLMSALMDGIETQSEREDADDADEQAEHERLAKAYRALADDLLAAQKAARG